MATRIGFAGQCLEQGLDVFVLGGRIYAPALRRFLNGDAASPMSVGGLNRYAYCGGDPIQRIDPSGNSWLDWLTSGLGLVGAIAGTVMSAIAFVGSVGLATPAIVALGAALVLDAVAVVAEVGSIAGLVAGDSVVAQTFGWIAMGAGLASAGAAGISRAGSNVASRVALAAGGASDTTSAARSIKRTILPIDSIDEWRLSKDLPKEDAWTGVVKSWHRVASEQFPDAIHYGPDSQVSSRDVWRFVNESQGRAPKETKTYLYGGVHGAEDGQNWHGSNRIGADLDELVYSQRMRRAFNAKKGRAVDVVNLAFLSPDDAVSYWIRPGIHIHGYCFGVVDELLLTTFGKTEAVTVYV